MQLRGPPSSVSGTFLARGLSFEANQSDELYLDESANLIPRLSATVPTELCVSPGKIVRSTTMFRGFTAARRSASSDALSIIRAATSLWTFGFCSSPADVTRIRKWSAPALAWMVNAGSSASTLRSFHTMTGLDRT